MKKYDIGVIGGDGIGPEVTTEAMKDIKETDILSGSHFFLKLFNDINPYAIIGSYGVAKTQDGCFVFVHLTDILFVK